MSARIRTGFRWRIIVSALVFLGAALLSAGPAAAGEKKNDKLAEPITKGQRVFTCGHSFHVWVPDILSDLCKKAEIPGHVQVGVSSIGGSRVIQHWDIAEDKNKAKEALKTGKVDVLTLSPIFLPDAGIENFTKLALEHNKDIRIAVQPIWLDRTFAFCAPFVAIAYGVAIGGILTRLSRGSSKAALYSTIGLVAAATAGGAWLAYVQVTTPYKPDHYRELARYLAEQVKPGEIIYAPDAATFWGVSRYLIGPDWGTIFQVQDTAELSRLKKWQRMYAVLGPTAAGHLGLLPTGRRLDSFRVSMFIGFSPLPDLANVTAVWLLVSDDVSLDDLRPCAGQLPAPSVFGRLLAYRVPCP